MSTSAIPSGRATALNIAAEATYGVAPVSGFKTRHCYACTLNRKNEPQDESLLGRGLQNDIDDQDPAPDLESAGATIRWAFGINQVGFVLTELFGAPDSSDDGMGNYTHVFSSGGLTLPSRCVEQKLGASLYKMGLGLVAKKAVFAGGSGKGFCDIPTDYLARQTTAKYASSLAGAPTSIALSQRLPRSAAQLSLDGARADRILDWSLTLEPQLQGDSYDGDAFEVSDVGLVGYKATWDVTARFKTGALSAYGDIASGEFVQDPIAAKASYILDSTHRLDLLCANVRFSAVEHPVEGPGFITTKLRGRAEASAVNAMVQATLLNTFATAYS